MASVQDCTGALLRSFKVVGVLRPRKATFLDLLFYHHALRRFVVIELKIGKFEPEFVSKMNFYLNAVDEQLRRLDGWHAPAGAARSRDHRGHPR